MSGAERSVETDAMTAALVARVLYDNGPDCEVVGFSGSGRCIEPAVAARFDGQFIDLVCAEHAERAKSRGTAVVFPPAQTGADQ